jgi:hypothetical protein
MTAGFYHCSVKPVGRASGRSVVAAAAYRSGERLADERTGEVFDYRARGGVVDTFILTRDGVGAWERARLWNAAERIEPRANGRLATEIERRDTSRPVSRTRRQAFRPSPWKAQRPGLEAVFRVAQAGHTARSGQHFARQR